MQAELERFREVQRLSYECAATVAATLEAGVTETVAADRMRAWLTERGVREWFHEPFAWFGDRTAFRGFRTPLDFFPTARKLELGMPFILDCAPVVDGYTADIGYTGALGDNPLVERLLDDLCEHRALIVERVRERQHLATVSRAVDELAARQGSEPRHKQYPFEVLAHRVDRLPEGSAGLSLARFGVRSLIGLAAEALRGRLDGNSPFWSSGPASDHPPTPGLWAVEPHLGQGAVGAKFEELLVVTDDEAFWLDDDLPHVRRWRSRGLARAVA